MPELKTAITAVEAFVAVVVILLVGDFLGFKVGRWRLASLAGIVTLAVIIAFAIYAAVNLPR